MSHPKETNKPASLLDQMPSDIGAVSRWFDTLTDEQFDRVCCGAIVSAIIEGAIETGEVPIPVVKTLVVSMRDRYRKMNLGHCGGRQIDYADLLGRPERKIPDEELRGAIDGKVIAITGAGGSIGSEIALICAMNNPSHMILIERSEAALFDVHRRIIERHPYLSVRACLHDITRREGTLKLFERYDTIRNFIDVVFHAAAYKHVPMLEDHLEEAIRNNVEGTASVIRAAKAIGVSKFILISTDKAAHPSSTMGATKKIAEWLIRHKWDRIPMQCSFVRFGNVLGSSGSVLDIWERQLLDGRKPTITDRKMTRYFMTIPEAAAMVIRSSTLGQGGYVLDMGKPIKIERLCKRFAEEMLRLRRIARMPITRTVGIREGEKMHEILVDDGNLVPSGAKWINRLELPPLLPEQAIQAQEVMSGDYSHTERAIEKILEKKLEFEAA